MSLDMVAYGKKGQVVDRRFRLDAPIGGGAFGVVWRGIDTFSGKPVAIKILHRSLYPSATDRARFMAEAEILRKIRHPNIADVIMSGKDGELLYSAMEYVGGTNLRDRMSLVVQQGGRCSVFEIKELMENICRGLGHAHSFSIVHRDVKPENIVLTDLGTFSCKVVDFGAARMRRANVTATTRGRQIGTWEYMAPEQIEGTEVDARADVFALGCVLFELATLRSAWLRGPHDEPLSVAREREFETPNTAPEITSRIRHGKRPRISHWRPKLGPMLDQILARALAYDPTERFASAREFLSAIDSAL